MLTVGTLINYLDRTVISVAAPLMTKELGLSAVAMGVVFSAFSWTYAAAQIPGGILLDRIRRAAHLLLVGDDLVRVHAAPGPHDQPVVADRLPHGAGRRRSARLSLEQSRPRHLVSAGRARLGHRRLFDRPVLRPRLPESRCSSGSPETFGWRALLIIVGAAGILFGFVWYAFYRDPHESRANQAELDYIAAGGGVGQFIAACDFEWRHIAFLLRKRQILGASIGQFASNSTLVFFLTWFPTYLATERQMGWIKVGFFTVLPFIAACVGVMTGGLCSDLLLRRTGSANVARKLPIIAGLLLASTIVIANFVTRDTLVIVVMSVAFFGQGMCNLGWTLLTDVAPKELMGLSGGVFNLCANLAGIVTPLVVGFVVGATGSFAWALAFIGDRRFARRLFLRVRGRRRAPRRVPMPR